MSEVVYGIWHEWIDPTVIYETVKRTGWGFANGVIFHTPHLGVAIAQIRSMLWYRAAIAIIDHRGCPKEPTNFGDLWPDDIGLLYREQDWVAKKESVTNE